MFDKKTIVISMAVAAAVGNPVQAQSANTWAEANNTAADAIEELVVMGHIIAGEQQAINAQRNARNIVNAVSADGIGKLPDRNAAEAVQRVPGVSIERDQGEGRFVAVRGLPAQWSSTTLNGDRIPTAEEETTSRATAFDFFPTEMIERVEVSKTQLPDMEGDAIGGNVNFVTATSPDERVAAATVAANYNDKAGTTGYSTNLLYGNRSEDEKFGFILNGSLWQRDWATDNFEPRRGSDGLGIYRLELRDYTGERTTHGINAAGDYRPNENHKIYVRHQYGSLTDDETHYKHRYRFDKNRIELQHIFNELITEFSSTDLGAEHQFENSTLDWKISQASNTFRYGCIPDCEDNSYFVVRFDQKNIGFQNLENRGYGNYSYNEVDAGTTPADRPDTHLPDGFSMDPTKTLLSWVEFYKVDVSEKDKVVAQFNYESNISDQLDIKIGGKFREKNRTAEFADEFYQWNSQYGAAPSLADFTLIDQPGRFEYDTGKGSYAQDFSQVVSRADIVDWYSNNKEKLELVESESALISNGAALGRNFTVDEQQSALYLMANWELNDTWNFAGGVRLENTATDVHGLILIESTGVIQSNDGAKNYLSVLPSFNSTYQFNDDSDLRFAVSRSFARPDFGDLNPGGSYSEADNQFVSGNAYLNPTYSDNVDVIFSHYIGNTGVISAGAFYKEITDPIFKSIGKGEFLGNTDVEFVRPENGENAKLWGSELTFSRQLDFLPGIWQHLGINSNITLMESEMTIGQSNRTAAIPRQANEVYNLSLYFDNSIFAARIGMNHKGAYIVEHGSSSNFDTYYGENTSIDFSATYQINDNLMIFLDLNNLTDEGLQYYIGNESRPDQVEYYGRRGQLGVKVNF